MRRKLIFWALLAITLLALFVRSYHLSAVPPSPYLDEVSNGYNAFSLLKTGNDEYGKHLPLLMQAYNDFRPTLFVYLLTPFIWVLGLSVFAIRLPAVLLSVLATVSLFFLTRELLAGTDKKRVKLATGIGLLASFLYAISPWSIYSARIADEINMSLSLFIVALAFFLYALNRKLKLIPFLLSVVCFVIAFYAYHGIKFFLPFFLVGIALLFFKDFLARWKVSLIGLLLGIVLLIPLVFAFSGPGTTARLGGVRMQDPNIIALSAKRVLFDKTHNDRIGELFDNRRVLLSLEFANNYLRNFAPTWLFLQQGNRTFLVPDFGPFYLFELPLLILGIVMLIRDDAIGKRKRFLLLLWILASVIPAGLSSESPHLNRPNTLLPGLIVLQAMGLYFLLRLLAQLRPGLLRIGSYVVLSFVIVLSFVWFLHAYFVNFPYQHAKMYQYGVTDAFRFVKENENNYDKIIISNRDNLLDGYMYYLFTTQYDPALYQKQGGTHSAFFTDTHLIGKYDFRDPNLYEPTMDSKTKQAIKVLYLTNPSELSEKIVKNEGIRVMKKIQFPDGTDALWLLEGKIENNL